MTQLLEDLRQAATPAPPKDFAPGVIYSGGQPAVITTPAIPPLEGEDDWDAAVKAMGITLPEGFTLQLERAEYAYNAAAWQRDQSDVGVKHSAYTAPSHLWRYKFKVVLKSLRSDPDLAKLQREATRAVKGRALKVLDPASTMVISLADFQVGKAGDVRGGTPQLLERSEAALEKIIQQVKKQRPAEIILYDGGDSTEGFESSPNADRTNDLQQTDQIRVWRRVFWRWITELAKFGVPLKVISVPSNHCRVRRGKAGLGPASDDWGLEVLSQVADMAAVNPERFGHLEFVVPAAQNEHITLTLPGGKVWSAAHGHQASSPNSLIDWAKGKSPREIKLSDIVHVNHFHHLRVIQFGEDQTLFISPTMDAGSAYYTAISGEHSEAGVLTYIVDSSGWRDLFVAWV